MAIIYSYPVVTPTADDYVLGTDATTADKPTKNFTIQSIVDIVSGGAAGLGAVLAISSDASDPTTGVNQSASNFLNVQGTGIFTAATFLDGTMSITGGIGTGFSSITSTDFVGNLTGIVQAGSSIAGLAGGTDAQNVLGVTQNVGDNSTRLATTAYVMAKVDPSVLTFVGTTGGNQTVNLTTETLSLLGTANQIESVSTAQTITFNFPAAGVILPDGSAATTQAAADNSTLVATTAFVNTEDDAQDLDFTGDTGTSSVLLNSQTLDFEGTNLQITTAVTAQKVKFTLPTNVTIGGTFTGTTFAGDLLGTVNTATTGVTQSAGDDSTLIATTAYVDNAAGAKTLDYAGDATGPFALNLSTDDLEFNGDSNITITAAAVAATKGIVTIDLNNDVTISGTMQAGTLSDGTFSGTAGTYTGGVSITSTTFVGALTGNADSATALAATGNITLVGGESTSPAYLYTSGGAINIVTTLVNSAVTGKILTGLTVPTTGNSIEPADTILGAFGKLQAQHNTQVNGLRFMGAWNANTNSPTLVSGGTVIVSGTNTSVVADQLVDSTKDFTALGVAVGERVYNQAGAFTTVATAGVGTTTLTLDEDIFLTNGQTYSVDNDPALNQGEYYVVDTAGNTSLNGIAVWAVGDWVMAGATNVWEKLDGPGVEGNGTINRIPRWDTVNSLNDSIILQSGSGITLDTGKHFATVGAGTITSADLLTASAAFDLTGGITLPVSGYGTAGQVLTNIAVGTPAAGVDLVWTTPTTGTVESVTASDGILIGGTAVDPTVAIRYADSDAAGTIKNAIEVVATATPVATDMLWFSDADANTNINEIKKATIADIVDLGNETLSEVLSNGNTTGATKISVNNSSSGVDLVDDTKIRFGDIAGTPDLEIYHTAGANSIIKATVSSPTAGPLLIQSDNLELQASSVSEKFLTTSVNAELNLFYNNVKKFETTATGIKVTGTILELEGATPTLTIDDSTTNAGDLTVNVGSSIATYTSEGESTGPTYGQHVFKQKDGPSGTLRTIMTLAADQNVDLVGGIDTSSHLTTSGVVKTSDGSAGAPAYTFGSETTLGLYRAGADILGIDANTIRYRMGSATHAQLSYSASSVEFNVGNGLTTSTTGKLIIEGLCKTTIEQNLSVTGAGVTFTYGYNATPADGGNLQFTSSNGTVLNLKNDRSAQLNAYGSGTIGGTTTSVTPGVTQSPSTTLTLAASNSNIDIGMLVTGPQIQANTLVTNVSGADITLSITSGPSIDVPANATMTFTAVPTYNLSVNSSGEIIETPTQGGGGKSGTFEGSGTFTGGAAAAKLVTIERGNTGVLVFDIYLTMGTAALGVMAKKYTVARGYNSTANYNKLIESVELSGDNFTVDFNSAGNTATAIEVRVAATGNTGTNNISYTIQVGYDSINGVTVS